MFVAIATFLASNRGGAKKTLKKKRKYKKRK
jgi:hypothetical protein